MAMISVDQLDQEIFRNVIYGDSLEADRPDKLTELLSSGQIALSTVEPNCKSLAQKKILMCAPFTRYCDSVNQRFKPKNSRKITIKLAFSEYSLYKAYMLPVDHQINRCTKTHILTVYPFPNLTHSLYS
jgi:hypothetical protein